MINVTDLCKSYRRVHALNHVSLQIEQGVFGLLGPNGAGKTTLMRILATVLPPTSGKASVYGHDVVTDKLEIRKILGYLPQQFGSYRGLTGREYLEYVAYLKQIPRGQRQSKVDEVLEFVRLTEAANRRTTAYSGGMLRRLGIAQALLSDPRFLIVDEPTGGLDPEERLRFRNFLVDLSGDRTIILSTHLVEDIMATCNSLAVLNKGEIIYCGPVNDMMDAIKGKVYEIQLSESRLPSFQQEDGFLVVSTRRLSSDTLAVRFLQNGEKPLPESALPVEERLEEAYLALIHRERDQKTLD